jgi:hypothetical protein
VDNLDRNAIRIQEGLGDGRRQEEDDWGAAREYRASGMIPLVRSLRDESERTTINWVF